MNHQPIPTPSLPDLARPEGVGSTPPSGRADPFYGPLGRLTEASIEALFSEAEVRVSARSMTKQEREAGHNLPHGLVDRESIEARSLTVSTKCPHCGVELVSHVMGSVALVCPK